jgi:intracellular septation protein A
MVNKTISAVILSASVVIAAIAPSQPDNILFLFISPNKFIAACRVILALGMVFLSFRGYIGNRKLRESALCGGLVLTAFGIATLLITPLTNAVYDQVKLLDAMILAQAGIVFANCALSLPAKLPKVRVQKAPARAKTKLQHKTA